MSQKQTKQKGKKWIKEEREEDVDERRGERGRREGKKRENGAELMVGT